MINVKKDNNMKLLIMNIHKFEKGENFLKQIQLFLEIIENKEKNRDSKNKLKGYLYLYEETCTSPDCALKKFLHNYKFNNSEIHAFLLQHAEFLYQSGISKFPNCTKLRISYGSFLIDRMNKKQQGLIEFGGAEKYSPSFEEQFVIFRYRKIVEESSIDIGGEYEENLDVVSNFAYKNHFKQCKFFFRKNLNLFLFIFLI